MASSSNFVLKAYKTEANARADSNPLAVNVASGALSEEGSTIDNPSQASGYGFWAFQRYWYRIVANEPVTEFHIDWDDGEDNSPKKANVSIIKNDKPSFVGIVSHIFTQSKSFYPLIRVKSVEGFLSKWYTPHAFRYASGASSTGLNTFVGLDDSMRTVGTGNTSALNAIGLDSGQNSFSVVSMEQKPDGEDGSTAYARIPVFNPANVPPVGVLKTDRKRAFAGIDNDWLGHNNRILNSDSTEMPYSDTLYAFCSNPSRTGAEIKVTYQEGRLGGVSSKTQFYVDVGAGSYSTGDNQGYTVADLEDKVIYIRTMDEIYGYYIGWKTANTSSVLGDDPPSPTVSGAVMTPVTITTGESEIGGNTYLHATDLVNRLAVVMNAQTYHARDEFSSVTSSLIEDGSVESFIIGMGTESPSAGSFTSSNETSSTVATTTDDGLTTYDTGGNTYGNYFTFEATGYGDYYVWMRQLAKAEVFTIGVGGSNFSGSNEITSITDTAADGLSSPAASGTPRPRYGSYLEFASPSTSYYMWMRQAARTEKFTIVCDTDDPFSLTPYENAYVTLYDTNEDNEIIFWLFTGSETAPSGSPGATLYTQKVILDGSGGSGPGATAAISDDQVAEKLSIEINNPTAIVQGLSSPVYNEFTTTYPSGGRNDTFLVECDTAGMTANATTNAVEDRIVITLVRDGLDLGLNPSGVETYLASGRTAIVVDYIDNEVNTSINDKILAALQTAIGSGGGNLAVVTEPDSTTVQIAWAATGFCTNLSDGGTESNPTLDTGFTLTVTADGKNQSLNPSGKHSLSGKTAIAVSYTDGVTKATIATAIFDALYAAFVTVPNPDIATVIKSGSGDSTIITVAFTEEGNVTDGSDGSDSEASIDLSTGFTFAITQGDSDRYKIIATNTNTGLVGIATQSGATHPFSDITLLTAGTDASDGSIKQKTLTCTTALHNDAKLINVVRVLKAELVNNLEATDSYGGSTNTDKLYPGERIYLQAGLNPDASNLLPTVTHRDANPNLNGTICSISLGNPIIEEKSLGTRITVDATESKIRCSNKSISYYYMDDNKLISGDTAGNTADNQAADSTYNVTDKLVNGADFRSTLGTKDLRYSFDWWRDHQDSNYRYYSVKRLVRAQIKDDHTQTADDGLNTSPIVHWDTSSYLTVGSAAALSNGQPSEISKWNYGAFLFTNSAKLRTPNWYNLNVTNRGDRTPIFGSDAALTHTLSDSTAFDDISTQSHYSPDNVSAADETPPSGDTVGPRNALFMARKEKFDRIFVRVSHDRLNAAALTLANLATDITPGTTTAWPKIRLQALYPAKKTRDSSTIVWKALPIVDRTKLGRKDDSSFYKSGEIIFIPPTDWEKTSHSANIEYPYEDNFFDDYDTQTEGIIDNWTEDSYALIFLITQIKQGAEVGKSVFNVMSMHTYNNSHSQLIEIKDPMHVSLNNYGIAQSVSFVRKGKYQEIKDRSGISQMRRVGAEGGNIKLGGIDLKSDPQTTRAKFNEFQNESTPLYYDITHRDDSKTRLFGVMTDMSEDHPTAKVTPKFACSLTVTHILEIDSSGNITGDGYRPLGGDIIDAEQYLSAS